VVVVVNNFWPLVRALTDKLREKGYEILVLKGKDLIDGVGGLPSGGRVHLVLIGDDGDVKRYIRLFRARETDPLLSNLPLVLIGGFNLVLRARELYAEGVDEIIAADSPVTEASMKIESHLRLRRAYLELISVNERLKELSMTDDLTGLPNRRWFQRDIRKGLEMAKRLGTSISCIMVDLDDFKDVNDRYGHRVGDMVLVKFGATMNEIRRGYDVVARLGGDEFGWIVYDADVKAAFRVAERAKRVLSSHPFVILGHRICVTASFGVASFEGGSIESHEELIERADRALYMAKESGKNRVVSVDEKGEEIEAGSVEIS